MKWIDGYITAHLSRDVRYFLGIVNSTTFHMFEILQEENLFIWLLCVGVLRKCSRSLGTVRRLVLSMD